MKMNVIKSIFKWFKKKFHICRRELILRKEIEGDFSWFETVEICNHAFDSYEIQQHKQHKGLVFLNIYYCPICENCEVGLFYNNGEMKVDAAFLRNILNKYATQKERIESIENYKRNVRKC